MDNKDVVHLHNGILCGRKKEGTPTLCNSMDRTGENYTKGIKPVSERKISQDLTYMWNLMNTITNEQNSSRHLDT